MLIYILDLFRWRIWFFKSFPYPKTVLYWVIWNIQTGRLSIQSIFNTISLILIQFTVCIWRLSFLKLGIHLYKKVCLYENWLNIKRINSLVCYSSCRRKYLLKCDNNESNKNIDHKESNNDDINHVEDRYVRPVIWNWSTFSLSHI